MPMSKRQPLLAVTTGPGPWSYNIPTKFGSEGPKPVLIGKSAERQFDALPGPTTYTPNFQTTLTRIPVFPLSTTPRLDRSLTGRRNIPGPGHYKLGETLDGPKFKFHRSKKVGLQLNESVPGPGAYRVPCCFANTATYLLPNREDKFKFV
eukprot:TRINITY_DN5581_c0_g1_i2.p1 TRINITY_DN5581_c0_g1~~TRINITY_DN5581_c0_g1_i2.p1  ORF type:complete len:150 (+),score=17.95 TRINITY_DN5581_c0_g1_i2:222-671(+)